MFAALGNRREEGRIGFYQDSIGRDVFGGFLYQWCIFKRYNAGEGDIHAQIQSGFGKGDVFREAVNHAGVGVALFQNPQCVFGCITRVDDNGQAAFVGGLDMVGKALMLP